MKKLYYKNQYIKNFNTKVKDIIYKDNLYHIELEETAFFPGGGGQQCDLGFIDNEEVLDVYENNKIIYHVLNESIDIGKEVYCEIDWKRREEGMHNHLGQHILSGCFFKLFNANTLSIHLGKISTIDIIGILNENEIREAEKLANEVISNAIKVEFLTSNKEEALNLNLRRDLPNTDEEIRVVKIGDLDINACCGVHPSSTLDLRMIKIKKFEKNKGNTRIYFLAGEIAIKDSLNKDIILRDVSNYLSSSDEEILNGIKNLKDTINNLYKEKKNLEDELLEYEENKLILNAVKVNDYNVIKNIFRNKSDEYVIKLANKITKNNNYICLFIIEEKENVNIIFNSSKNIDDIDLAFIFNKNKNIIEAKGGGKKNFIKGFGRNKNIDEFINNIYNEIRS